MSNFGNLFNLSGENFVDKPTGTGNLEMFKPNADDGKDGEYLAIVRFVPWHKSPANSKIKVFKYWLEDLETGDGFSVICPKSVGQKSMLHDMYYALNKSKSAVHKDMQEMLSRRTRYYSLVQIVQDDNKPENVGKIMVWEFGTTINDQIEEQINKKIGKPFNPFDLGNAKNFVVKVTKKGEYNNYDGCYWDDEKGPIVIDGKQMDVTSEADRQAIGEYLSTNSPDFDKYSFQPWDEDTIERVMEYLDKLVHTPKILSSVFKSYGYNYNQWKQTSEDQNAGLSNAANTGAGIEEIMLPSEGTQETPPVVDGAEAQNQDEMFDGL